MVSVNTATTIRLKASPRWLVPSSRNNLIQPPAIRRRRKSFARLQSLVTSRCFMVNRLCRSRCLWFHSHCGFTPSAHFAFVEACYDARERHHHPSRSHQAHPADFPEHARRIYHLAVALLSRRTRAHGELARPPRPHAELGHYRRGRDAIAVAVVAAIASWGTAVCDGA